MRILYATDGSEGALAAAHFISGLTHHRSNYVHIVTARDTEDTDDGSAVLIAAQAALGTFPGHVTTATVRADSTSEIAEAMLFAADHIGADLIALGACGRSAVARFFLGSVAEGIIRHAPIPVLVARPGGLPLREVVIGIDGSSYARQAACFTTNTFPLPADCSLRLVQAVPPPVWAGFPDPMLAGTSEQIAIEATEAARKKALEALQGFVQEIRHDEDQPVSGDVIVGKPATVLLDAASREGTGLIVVGSHGLTGFDRFLLGSVSERVVRHASCSVLVVKHHPENLGIIP